MQKHRGRNTVCRLKLVKQTAQQGEIHSLKLNYPAHLHNNCSNSPRGMNKNTLIYAAGLDFHVFALDGSWQKSLYVSLYLFLTY